MSSCLDLTSVVLPTRYAHRQSSEYICSDMYRFTSFSVIRTPRLGNTKRSTSRTLPRLVLPRLHPSTSSLSIPTTPTRLTSMVKTSAMAVSLKTLILRSIPTRKSMIPMTRNRLTGLTRLGFQTRMRRSLTIGMRMRHMRSPTTMPSSLMTGWMTSPPRSPTPRPRNRKTGMMRRMVTGSHPGSPTRSAVMVLVAASGSAR